MPPDVDGRDFPMGRIRTAAKTALGAGARSPGALPVDRAPAVHGYSLELRLVGSCLAWPRTAALAEDLRIRSVEEVSWEKVGELVRRHRVAGLVQFALRHAGVAPAPPIDGQLARLAQETAFEELRLATELSRLMSLFRRDGVEGIVLKGLAAAVQGFGRVGLRQNRDIDLLFKPEDVPAVGMLLDADGYEQVEPEGRLNAAGLKERVRTHKDIVYRHPGRRTVVEVHWRLFDNREFASSMALVEPIRVRLPTGGEILALPASSALLFMSGHGAQHAWSRLKWLADFAAYCTAFGETEVSRLYGEARSTGLGSAMAQGLLLAEELLGLPIPDALRADVSSSWRLRLLRHVGRQALGSDAETAELEDRVFGSTLKTLSHYLLNGRLSYLAAQLALDASEPPTAHDTTFVRRLGPFAKAPLWVYDRVRMAIRR